jgi:hypothetical protein
MTNIFLWRSRLCASWYNYENNQQDALYRSIYYSKSALHVSGNVFAPIVRSTWLYLQYLVVFHPSCSRLVSRRDTSRQQLGWTLPGTVNTVKCSWRWSQKHSPKHVGLTWSNKLIYIVHLVCYFHSCAIFSIHHTVFMKIKRKIWPLSTGSNSPYKVTVLCVLLTCLIYKICIHKSIYFWTKSYKLCMKHAVSSTVFKFNE